MARRERTRHLIELGDLAQKAGLVGLADDDRAMLYGGFLDMAQRMRGRDGEQVRLLMRRRGARAFAEEAEAESREKSGDVISTDQTWQGGTSDKD